MSAIGVLLRVCSRVRPAGGGRRLAPWGLPVAWAPWGLPVAWAQQGQPQIGIAPVVLSDRACTFDTAEQHRIRVVVVARRLVRPFSLAFLPNGDALVTERGTRLRIVRNATGPLPSGGAEGPRLDPDPVAGLPPMPAFRGGGLQEIALHPQFAANGLVYFTYNKAGETGANPGQRQSAVTLARGQFDGKALTGVEDLFVGDWNTGASGSRIAFGPGGLIYMTTGRRSATRRRQLNTVYGKVLRLRDDSKVPADNPLSGRAGSRTEIFSLGHRDQLGLTIHAPPAPCSPPSTGRTAGTRSM